MRDSLQQFEGILEDYITTKNIQSNLMELVESLYRDLENERELSTNLRKSIADLTEQEVFGLSSKYYELKETCKALQNDIASLKNEVDDLHFEKIANDEQQKRCLKEKVEELQVFYGKELKKKEEELTGKQTEIDSLKDSFKQKEKALFEEVRAAEVSSVHEIDKVQNNLQKQLNDCLKKLKDSVETCNVLRVELMSTKEELNDYRRTANERIADLQRKLQANASNKYVLSDDDDDFVSKYQPLDENRPVNLKKKPKNKDLPPLFDLSNNVNRKRKLFNPDDLSYLDNDH